MGKEDLPSVHRHSGELMHAEAPVLRLGKWTIVLTKERRFGLSFVGLTALCAIGYSFLSEFDQTRGIVNLAYSRVWLFGLSVVIFLGFWLVSGQLFKRQLWALLLSLVVAAAAFAGIDKWAPKPPPPTEPCSLAANTTSVIISRVHSRATWDPSGSTELYKPVFQDLFHDWIITLNPQGMATQVVVTIQDPQRPLDSIRVLPVENAIISNSKPGWISGFDEPSQIPDFYLRTVSFYALSKPTKITIRRPIQSKTPTVNTITAADLDLDRVVRVSAESCNIVYVPPPSKPERFDGLARQLRFLALLRNGANGDGIRRQRRTGNPNSIQTHLFLIRRSGKTKMN